MSLDLSVARDIVAEYILVDGCEIRRPPPPGSGTLNEETLERDAPEAPLIYAGPCGFTDALSSRNVEEIGSAVEFPFRYVLKLPWNAPEVKPGDTVTATTSVNDPHLPGQTFRARQFRLKSTLVLRNVALDVDVPEAEA